MTYVPESVAALEHDLRDIFGQRLQSLVAYGLQRLASRRSEAPHQGAHHGHAVRTETLAIVESLTLDDLKRCAERTATWHDGGLATPLLLVAHEFERSLDAFPLEFGTILADHVVVHGSNPLDGLQIAAADLRRGCEVQARSHLLHLREGYLEARGRLDALAVLIVRSAAPFAALLATVARLDGHEGSDLESAGRHAERTLKLPSGAVTEIVKLVHVREIPSSEAARIFRPYLDAVERLVAYIDGWGTT